MVKPLDRDILAHWRRLVGTYQRLAATRWGYNVFGRALPAAFFLVGFYGGLNQLQDIVPAPGEPSLVGLLTFLQELLQRFIGLCLVVLFVVRKPPLGRPTSLTGAVVALAATFYGAVIIFFDALGIRAAATRTDPTLGSIAFALGLAGTCLLAWSYLHLGRNFGIFPEVRGLVTSGPYRYLRHPFYTAYLLGAAGGPISAFSGEALLIFLTYFGLINWRAALEERVLEEVFGDQYRHYRASTWGLGADGPLTLAWKSLRPFLPRRLRSDHRACQSSIASPKL